MIACLQWLIDATVSLSLLVALLLLIRRPVARHIGAVTAYRLWLLVPLHLAAPFLFPEGLVIYQVDLSPLTVRPGDATLIMASASVTAWPVAVLLWLSGLAYALAHLVLAILAARRLVRESRPLSAEVRRKLPVTGVDSPNVRETFLVGAPIVAGLFRPTLLLPPDFAERHTSEERRLILAHEASHMRRRDNLATVAAHLCTAIFWFNPLVHFAYRAFRTDQELSCDAMVLHGLSMGERKAYGRALVKSAATMEPVAVTSSWQNHKHLKERTMMLKSHRHTPARALGGLLTMATLAVAAFGLSVSAFATDAADSVSDQANISQPPEIVERVPPKYPRDAAEGKVEGSVEMQFTVDAQGRVRDVSVINSDPGDVFDSAAVASVREWRFNPALKDGEPVPVETRQTIHFELD